MLADAARGDQDAWRQLVALYARRVFGLARSRCRNDDLAEEITQSVFATIATKLTSGGYSEQGRFEAWLFRVTMNRVRDEMRRRKRQAPAADPASLAERAPAVTQPFSAGANAELESMRRALDQLDEADREIVCLRHHAGLSFKVIATMLLKPLGTVLARHHRALKKLRGLMESEQEKGDTHGE